MTATKTWFVTNCKAKEQSLGPQDQCLAGVVLIGFVTFPNKFTTVAVMSIFQ